MTGGDERPPLSWAALAAELAAGQELGAERDEPVEWDTVAAALAADLATVGQRRPEGAAVPPLVEAPTAVPTPQPDAERAPPREELPPEELDPEELDPDELRGGLEALLFVVDTPIDEATLAATLRCPPHQVGAGLTALAADYDGRRAGVTLRRVGEGWRLYTREDHAAAVERYLLEGQRSRLTQAALETLAVIAYRQPVTRARVSAIRGVGVDAVMRTLIGRGLVTECGSDPDSGGGLYATTPLFLERLGLTGLDELPELAPLLPETGTLLDE